MNKTLTISSFAGMLSRQSGYTVEFCEQFVAEMFRTATEGLKETGETHIKGLGKFIVNGSDEVVFIPEDTFATEINAPFECFEPEPLDDEVTDDILEREQTDSISIKSDNIETVEETPTVETTEPKKVSEENDIDSSITVNPDSTIISDNTKECSVEIVDVPDAEDSNNEDPETTTEQEPDIKPENDSDKIASSETVVQPANQSETNQNIISKEVSPVEDNGIEDDNNVVYENSAGRKRLWPFISGFALGTVLGAAITFFLVSRKPATETTAQILTEEKIVSEDFEEPESDNSSEKDITTTVEDNQTIKGGISTVSESDAKDSANDKSDVSIATKEPAVYDTVTTTLSQLSRKHYGSYHFWVYIYEENKDLIPDPDRVEPGTKLLIPSAEKYGIDYKNKESINNALKKAQEIAGK